MQLTLECRQQQEEEDCEEGGSYLTGGRQTAHRETFKAEFTYTTVRPLRLIAICYTGEEEKKQWGGG